MYDNDDVEIIEGTGEILEDKSETGRIRPWNKHKKYNETLADLYDKALDIEPTLMSHARLNSITDCGDCWIDRNMATNAILVCDVDYTECYWTRIK